MSDQPSDQDSHEQGHNESLSREELLARLRQCRPATRSTTVQVIEGRASDDEATFVREQLAFVEDLVTREVNLISSRTCDCGALLSERNRLRARASCCGALTCDECGVDCCCRRCGRQICVRHKTTMVGEAYCPRCVPIAALKLLVFGSGKKEANK